MRTALVFGGTGQIGAPVVERLLANGWQVHAVSRTMHKDRGRLNWLIGDLDHVHGLPAQVDAIFSLGPLDLFSHWYAGTRMPASRVVAFGSTSLETKQDSADDHERDLAGRLREAEARIFAAAKELQAKATVLRPTLVYGAGRDKTLTRVVTLARRMGFFVLPRDANGLRQPVHVDDLADAALAVVDADAVVSASCACNIAGVQANGATIVDLISQLLARSLRMRKSPWVSSFIHHRTRHRRPIARG